jgi:glycosyltransferase involved in cell wall biosynthesis
MIDISLLICTRNRSRSLATLLASVEAAAGQWPDGRIELILVDNGSTDATAAIIRHWATDRPFTVRLLSEPRPGLARARNMALRAARGRIVAMTDDDCVLHLDYFARLAQVFARQPAPVIIGGRILLGDPDDLMLTVKLEDHPMIAEPDSFPGGFVMGANLAFTADVGRMVGPFDERFGVRSGEDVGDQKIRIADMAQHGVASQRLAQCLAGVDTGLRGHPAAIYIGDRTQRVDTDHRDDQVAVVPALTCPEQGRCLFIE